MRGLEGVDQYAGHLEAQISLHLIFFLWGYINPYPANVENMVSS